MSDLAVIIPYSGEFPHVHYTLQSLLTELSDQVSFEIILVDNSPTEQQSQVDRALDCMLKDEKDTSWLIRLKRSNHFSHWGAKNDAVSQTNAPFLFFLDAHCLVAPGTLRDMFRLYKSSWEMLNGSLHLPISDFLKADWPKVYRLVYDEAIGLLHYENKRAEFKIDDMALTHVITIDKALTKESRERLEALIASWRDPAIFDVPYYPVLPVIPSHTVPAPCMSTCGMMCHRSHIVDDLQYWPEELGSYGGGENYYNFTMARLGRNINIFPVTPLRHWSIPGVWSRDYQITYSQWAENIVIATYLVAGEEWVDRLLTGRQSLPDWHPVRCLHGNRRFERGMRELITRPSLVQRHDILNERALMTIEQWAEKWIANTCASCG